MGDATPPPISLADTLRPAPDVLVREIDGESVLVNLDSGLFFGLDPIGTRIWAWLKEHGELERVLDRILEHYEVERPEAEADLLRLVTELRAEGLVAVADDAS